MKIIVDRSRCTSIGLCTVEFAPALDFDEEGNLQVLVGEISGNDLEHAKSAVHACPTAALSLVGGDC